MLALRNPFGPLRAKFCALNHFCLEGLWLPIWPSRAKKARGCATVCLWEPILEPSRPVVTTFVAFGTFFLWSHFWRFGNILYLFELVGG